MNKATKRLINSRAAALGFTVRFTGSRAIFNNGIGDSSALSASESIAFLDFFSLGMGGEY